MGHGGQKTATGQNHYFIVIYESLYNASKKCLKFLSKGKKRTMRIKLFQKFNEYRDAFLLRKIC